MAAAVDAVGASRIGYRPLRDAMRHPVRRDLGARARRAGCRWGARPEAPDRHRAPPARPARLRPHHRRLGRRSTTVGSASCDDGVSQPRLLPWESVVAHAVEPWGGGVIPAWWTDPARQHPDAPAPVPGGPAASPIVEADTDRRLPHAGAGALLSVQTRTGTYRFLRSGADPTDLGRRIGAFAVRHQGPAGMSTVTTVAPRRLRRAHRTGWARVRPYLVVLLVVVVVTTVTLILLQSSGAIHLPFLGGGASSAPWRPTPPAWPHRGDRPSTRSARPPGRAGPGRHRCRPAPGGRGAAPCHRPPSSGPA